MFFDEISKSTDPETRAWADRLYEAIRKKNPLAVYKAQKMSWRQSLAAVRKKVGPEETDRVLAWLEAHIGEEFIPVVRSGPEFRMKFQDLQRAMRSSEPPTLVDDPRNKTLVSQLLTEHVYPVEVISAMNGICQRSRENIEVFWVLLRNRPKSSLRSWSFVLQVINQFSVGLLTDWLTHLSKRLGHHEHYIGQVMRLAWRLDHEWFRESFWRQWSLGWCNDPKAFDFLLDDLIKESKK